MSTCCKCGMQLTEERFSQCSDDSRDSETEAYATVDCLTKQLENRTEELSNLRSLLRSVTIRLEKIREAFGEDGLTYLDAEDTAHIGAEIDAVLEALS